MTKVRKLLLLSQAVVDELSKEANQSALVDVLLGNFFEVPVDDEGQGSLSRAEVQNRLGIENDTVIPSPPTSEAAPVPEGFEDIVAPAEPVTHSDREPQTDTVTADCLTTQPEPPASAGIDVPIKVNGVPGNICDEHGAYMGMLCIDCL